jgi:hypothetical protein
MHIDITSLIFQLFVSFVICHGLRTDATTNFRVGSWWICGSELVLLLGSTGQLKCDGTRAETRFRLLAKRTSPFKSTGASVQSTTGTRGVRISGSNAGYTMFRGSVKSTGYPLHSPVSPSFPLPCVTVCHHISTGVYSTWRDRTFKGVSHRL